MVYGSQCESIFNILKIRICKSFLNGNSIEKFVALPHSPTETGIGNVWNTVGSFISKGYKETSLERRIILGYFSNLAIEHKNYDHDHSITPPETQLLWRLEELEDRLYELTKRNIGERDERDYFSEDDLRYVLPKHFSSASNVRKAIDLAINDLREQYGIYVGDAPEQEEAAIDEITSMQVTIFDILALQSQCAPLIAA